MAMGTAGSTEIARQMGAELTAKGNIRVNEKMETTIPGLFAAGDSPELFRCQRQFMKEAWQVSMPEHMSEEDMQLSIKEGHNYGDYTYNTEL